MLKKFCDYNDLHWYRLEEVMLKFPYWSWNFDDLSSNIGITEKILERYGPFVWNMQKLSANRAVSLKFIEDHLDWKWKHFYLSMNPSMTFKFMKRYKEWKWDTGNVIANSAFTPKKLLKKLGQKVFSYIDRLSSNTSLTMEFVEEHIDAAIWNVDILSDNTALTMEFVEKYIYWSWNMKKLSANKSVTREFVEKYIEMGWHFDILSSNHAIDVEFVKSHLDRKWDVMRLLANVSIETTYLLEIPAYAQYIEIRSRSLLLTMTILSIFRKDGITNRDLAEHISTQNLPPEILTVEYVVSNSEKNWYKETISTRTFDDFIALFHSLPRARSKFREEIETVSNMINFRPPTIDDKGNVVPGRGGGREYKQTLKYTAYKALTTSTSTTV